MQLDPAMGLLSVRLTWSMVCECGWPELKCQREGFYLVALEAIGTAAKPSAEGEGGLVKVR